MDVDTAVRRVEAEYIRATKEFGPMASAHEGYAVILEEMDELWEVIKNPPFDHKRGKAEEAIQVAAMAIRFLVDCC